MSLLLRQKIMSKGKPASLTAVNERKYLKPRARRFSMTCNPGPGFSQAPTTARKISLKRDDNFNCFIFFLYQSCLSLISNIPGLTNSYIGNLHSIHPSYTHPKSELNNLSCPSLSL